MSESITDQVFNDLLAFADEAKRNPLGLRRYRGRTYRNGRNTKEAFLHDVSMAYENLRGLNWDDERAKRILQISEELSI